MKTQSIPFAFLASLIAVMLAPHPADAKAPPGRFVVDVKGETVADTLTKLTWQRIISPQTMSATAATAYCKGLGLAGGGWRLPLIREAESILSLSEPPPLIDKKAFPNTPASAFWSSSVYAFAGNHNWFVAFGAGYVKYAAPQTDMLFVRCVR